VLTDTSPTLYKLDHHYSASHSKTGIVAVLYAEPGTKEFLSFHRALKSLADTHAIDYVLRPYVVAVNNILYEVICRLTFLDFRASSKKQESFSSQVMALSSKLRAPSTKSKMILKSRKRERMLQAVLNKRKKMKLYLIVLAPFLRDFC
jgi:Thioredoxin-like domain